MELSRCHSNVFASRTRVVPALTTGATHGGTLSTSGAFDILLARAADALFATALTTTMALNGATAYEVLAQRRREHYTIAIFDIERGTRTRLTFEEGSFWQPKWTPDGSRIVYTSATAGSDGEQSDIWIRPADGTG